MAPNYNSYEIKITTNSGNTWSTLGSVTSGIDFSMNADEFDKYILGKWDTNEEERNDIMNILDLYEEKQKEKIDNHYRTIINEEYENLDVVKEYKELITTFEINMKQLADKYNVNDQKYIYQTGYGAEYGFEIHPELRDNIRAKYKEEWENELKDLRALVRDVKAVLSISDDKDYQIEVLKNYDILDKKGKLNA